MRAEHDHLPSHLAQIYPNKLSRNGKPYPSPGVHPSSSYSHLPSSGRQSWTKLTQIGSGK